MSLHERKEWKLGDTPATEPSGEPFLSGSEISGRSLVISRDADAQEEIQDWSFAKGFQMYMQIGWILQEKQTTIL